jgi:hypothetical protein
MHTAMNIIRKAILMVFEESYEMQRNFSRQ